MNTVPPGTVVAAAPGCCVLASPFFLLVSEGSSFGVLLRLVLIASSRSRSRSRSQSPPPVQTQQVIGDASPDASKLMKREGVRSVPSFHYFVEGEKVDVVNGANPEAIEATITKHVEA